MEYILTEQEYDALRKIAEVTYTGEQIIHLSNQKYKDPLMKKEEDCIFIVQVRNGQTSKIRLTHDFIRFLATQLNPIDS